ncbi:MAG TPA: hypothetical protein VGN22_15270, partial [Pseudonocardia sp.]
MWLGLVVLAAALAVFAYGCGVSSFGGCAANDTCPADSGVLVDGMSPLPDGTVSEGGDAGSHDGGDAAVADSGCDPSLTPDLESCLIDTTYGVFVATPGSGGVADAAVCGTRSAPCATIALGAASAGAAGKSRIFVCHGAYAEAVQLAGMSLYGGFDCPSDGGTWTFADASTQLTGPSNQIALTLTEAGAGNFDVDDFVITAPDAVGTDDAGNGNSSLAVLVN